MTRDLDLVLLGATGFVGRLTAAHLARHAPEGLRVGLAARSGERLRALRDELGVDWPLLTVDTSDDAAVAALAGRTRVLATTVGPYLRYGLGVVAACAAAGTHYADLTGESAFVARSIQANHTLAGTTGARIVHSCGFDSVPSDLGLGLAHAATGHELVAEAVLQVRSLRGGISGGTVDSLRQQVLEARSDPAVRRVVADPYALTPGPRVRLPRSDGGIRRDPGSGVWQAPFVMGAYNSQVVQRTNYLVAWGYGERMAYRELIDTGRGWGGRAAAVGIGLGTAALMGAMSLAPTRALVDRVLPRPGEGPAEEQLARGRFSIDVDVYPVRGTPVRTTFGADLDPGYNGTAVMLGESALSLALDELPPHAGVLTPMVAMGDALAGRLRARGFTIATEDLG